MLVVRQLQPEHQDGFFHRVVVGVQTRIDPPSRVSHVWGAARASISACNLAAPPRLQTADSIFSMLSRYRYSCHSSGDAQRQPLSHASRESSAGFA